LYNPLVKLSHDALAFSCSLV